MMREVHRGWRLSLGLAWSLAGLLYFGTLTAAHGAVPSGQPVTANGEGAQALGQLLNDAEVRHLFDLLADPAVRSRVQESLNQSGVTQEADPASLQDKVQQRLMVLRSRMEMLAEAVPDLPRELSEALGRLMADRSKPPGQEFAIVYLFLFIAGGVGTEAIFRRATRTVRQRVINMRIDTVQAQVKVTIERLVYVLAMELSFMAGSLGAFLFFTWPPLIGSAILFYLISFVVVRFALVMGRFAYSPGIERFRVIPMRTAAAYFWHRWQAILVATAAFGWGSAALLHRLGVSEPERVLVQYGFGLLFVLQAIWMAWAGRYLLVPDSNEPDQGRRLPLATIIPLFVTAFLPLIWLLFVAGANEVAWLLIVAAALPVGIRILQQTIGNLMRAPDGDMADPTTSAQTVIVERAVRTALIVVAALVLAHAWDLDVNALAVEEGVIPRISRGLLSTIVIFLIADLIWQLAKTLIDSKISGAEDTGQDLDAEMSDEERSQRARIRTLLPILRNIMFVVLLAMSVLMALSAAGLQIGPLLAGASVVGVAVGFGAQALVKDIISGIFFLFDDAFRVGEYIESGHIRGTVEAFSLRSVKLRHHRGPLHTVPFGELKTVTNYSRDWVIDKITVGVTYDTDLDKVKKIIKQVSADIMTDPELAAVIIEPLKSQGVAEMGDFAIQIRMKVKTKPSEQFVVRRVIYDRIKKAFDGNGIKFAFPTVTVAGTNGSAEDVNAAVAQQVANRASAQRGTEDEKLI